MSNEFLNYEMYDADTRLKVRPYSDKAILLKQRDDGLLSLEEVNEILSKKRYYCGCKGYFDENLKYHYSKNWHLIKYGRRDEGIHAEGCPKHESYGVSYGYANALTEEVGENGLLELNARMSTNPLRCLDNTDTRADDVFEHTAKKAINWNGITKGYITLSALIKKVSLEAGYIQAIYNMKKGYRGETEFNGYVYGITNNVRLVGRRGQHYGYMNGNNNAKFVYTHVNALDVSKWNNDEGQYEYVETLTTINSEKLKEYEGSYRFKLIITGYSKKTKSEYQGSQFITKEALMSGVSDYEKTYKTAIDTENNNIVVGGYSYRRQTKNGVYLDELKLSVFLMVNKYGIYSESSYEVQCFDTIMDYINNGNRDVVFYKPYQYTSNAYDGQWLEDGIIQVVGHNKIGVVEVFGMNDEKYLEKAKLKEEFCKNNPDKYVFLSWWPQREDINVLKERLYKCIDEIRKS